SRSRTGTEMARAGTPAGRLTPAGSDGDPAARGAVRSSRTIKVATATVAKRNPAAISHSRAEPRRARTGVASIAASVVSDQSCGPGGDARSETLGDASGRQYRSPEPATRGTSGRTEAGYR